MKKFKILSLSLIAALCLGLSTPFLNAQALTNVEPELTPVADRIFVERLVEPTYTSAIWVTETRNGKTYSGYLYNRGFHPTNGYSIFNGWLEAASYVDPYVVLEDK